ncbi:hypothetical protein AUP68_17327 [Ilyonectria robusta]
MQSSTQTQQSTQACAVVTQPRLLARPDLKAEARSLDEDWSGLASAAERRRIQNRINARAYRKRNKALKATKTPNRRIADGMLTTVHISEGSSLKRWKAVMPSPRSGLLLTIVFINLKRALLYNFALLGHDSKQMCSERMDCSSPLGDLPADLQPTTIQRTVAHQVAIDAFPDANLRDRMIMSQHLINDGDFENDLLGNLSERGGGLGLQGLVIWGEPYLTSSWEITETFFRKWHFLVSGSPNLIASTNKWRRIRGEEPLVSSSSST